MAGQPLRKVRGKGKGARSLTLPIPAVIPSNIEAAELQSTDVGEPSIAGVRVVVVDDDADARELVAMTLEPRGAVIQLASSAAAALDYISRDKPDIMIADISMPQEDGYLLIHRLRALEGECCEKRLSAIALTALPVILGARVWFLCPHCEARVAVLYAAGARFLCRHCYDLPYSSQREDFRRRMMRKARKIRERLGASNNLFAPVWEKPKGMHWETFYRLCERERRANHLGMLAWLQEMEAISDACRQNGKRHSRDLLRIPTICPSGSNAQRWGVYRELCSIKISR